MRTFPFTGLFDTPTDPADRDDRRGLDPPLAVVA